MNIIDNVSKIQDSISSLNKQKTEALKNGEDTTSLDDAISINKEILRIIYTVMDGVVARVFNFDRPALRVMSENKQLGHLRKSEFDNIGLLKQLATTLRGNGICLINDITRYLRIGDITCVSRENKIIILEAKTDKLSGKTRLIDAGAILTNITKEKNSPNPQFRRQLIAQMSLINRRISIPNTESSLSEPYSEKLGVDIIDVEIKIKNHIETCRLALENSTKNIISSLQLEDGYSISILRCDQLHQENIKETLEAFDNLAPTWFDRKNPYMFGISNLQTFISEGNEFARNILPYSVFPFDNETCIKLMAGDIYIAIFLDATKLKKKLELSGWTVEDGEFVNILKSELPYQKVKRNNSEMFAEKDPAIFQLSKETEEYTFRTSLLGTQLLAGMFSFYAIDFFVETINEQFANSKPGKERYVTHNYTDERNIYI